VAERQDFPTKVVAEQMRALRTARGISAAKLAEQMAAEGVSFDKTVVANLELGRRRFVTVQELLGLAATLNVAPVHLLVPPLPSPLWGYPGQSRSPDDPNDPNDEQTYYWVTPTTAVPVYRARQFVRGSHPLPGADPRPFYAAVPPQEFDTERQGRPNGQR
jgi:transcriptional regulator with XRE-family HTH domain